MDQDSADQYVDVTDYMDTAIAALQAHASQVGEDVAKHMRNWQPSRWVPRVTSPVWT